MNRVGRQRGFAAPWCTTLILRGETLAVSMEESSLLQNGFGQAI